ncbi:MAG: hypothetical protein FWD66_00895 [Paludibacter sp.]|nr:hypothetical protein [Paludibacter sp.]
MALNKMVTKLEKLENAYKYLYVNDIISSKKEFAEKLDVHYTGLVMAFKNSEKHLTNGLLKKIWKTFPDIFNRDYFLKNDENMFLYDSKGKINVNDGFIGNIDQKNVNGDNVIDNSKKINFLETEKLYKKIIEEKDKQIEELMQIINKNKK